MKNFIKSLFVLNALVFLLFTSCQEEIVIEDNGSSEEAITENSTLLNLMQHTSAQVGYTDDILDDFSCGKIKLPVTVEVNGITIIIASDADLELVANIFDELDEDADIVHFSFPITIKLRNYIEIVINGQDQLDGLIRECTDRGDDDDEIECLDFVYPITMLTFNSNNDHLGSFVVENDAEMYLFLADIDATTRASIKYPITVKLSDGSTKQINSNQELQEAISKAKLECDEDDHSVDSGPFVRILTEGAWFINGLHEGGENLGCVFAPYEFHFREDGKIVVEGNGVRIEGKWRARPDDGRIRFEMNFEGSDLFDGLKENWVVFRFENGVIKLKGRSGDDREDYLIFKKTPIECHTEEDVASIVGSLVSGNWLVANYSDDGQVETSNYSNFTLSFSATGTVVATNGNDVVNGAWSVALNSSGMLKLNLDFDDVVPFIELTDSWDIASFAEARIEAKDFDDDDDDVEGYDKLVLEKI